ncbi:unnamed protein product [Fraxinus pennsylvanica]|uniref:Uncharacterized protein n=1 Tax=Fraxinus pennsylvanica TaxID=56036 RepID=A0AAD2DVH4_9LAMI|nr:unnamed protein product [Fraxinus pennsylvanica]
MNTQNTLNNQECNLEDISEEEEAPSKSSKDKKANGPEKQPSLGSSAKETELLREGYNVEEVCNSTKQVPGFSNLAKGMELSSGEAEIPDSSNFPLGSDSQTKMETDNLPTSGNAAKKPSVKRGKFHCAFCYRGIYFGHSVY